MPKENENENQEEELEVIENVEDLSDDDDEEEGHSEEDDRRMGASDEEEDDDEEGKPKRSSSNRRRRQRQKQGRDRTLKEVEFLRNRNEQLEKRQNQIEQRLGQNELGRLDQEIQRLKTNISTADQVIKRAFDTQKSDDFMEAQRIREGFVQDLSKLEDFKTSVSSQRAAAPARKETPRQADPRLVNHANKWMEKNDWWDPKGGDEDSLIVSAIDSALTGEGYDPTSKDYWDELSDRVKERLPHRTPKKRSRGPRLSEGKSNIPSVKKNQVYISPERKEAMMDAGVWDDPQLRQKYLKRYQQYDKEHQK